MCCKIEIKQKSIYSTATTATEQINNWLARTQQTALFIYLPSWKICEKRGKRERTRMKLNLFYSAYRQKFHRTSIHVCLLHTEVKDTRIFYQIHIYRIDLLNKWPKTLKIHLNGYNGSINFLPKICSPHVIDWCEVNVNDIQKFK